MSVGRQCPGCQVELGVEELHRFMVLAVVAVPGLQGRGGSCT